MAYIYAIIDLDSINRYCLCKKYVVYLFTAYCQSKVCSIPSVLIVVL